MRISESDYIYSIKIIIFSADLTFLCWLGESAHSGYVTRACRRRLPTAHSAGNRVKAADGASFVVFIFLE
jgi:hypothetical protein